MNCEMAKCNCCDPRTGKILAKMAERHARWHEIASQSECDRMQNVMVKFNTQTMNKMTEETNLWMTAEN